MCCSRTGSAPVATRIARGLLSGLVSGSSSWVSAVGGGELAQDGGAGVLGQPGQHGVGLFGVQQVVVQRHEFGPDAPGAVVEEFAQSGVDVAAGAGPGDELAFQAAAGVSTGTTPPRYLTYQLLSYQVNLLEGVRVMRLIYIFDAYCGWSHGFSATLREITARHPDLPTEVVSGGLFVGERRVPVREFGYIQGANAQIHDKTGAEFGDAYERLIADGSFVMDSEAAARGFAALRQAAPDRAAELAIAMQRAFYLDGLSLSDPATYQTVAEQAGLDGATVAAEFTDSRSAAAAAADFQRAAQLGVTGFPTLIAAHGDRLTPIAYGHASPDQVEERLAALSVR
jgi:putative protein-disulfide isomerase